MRVVAVVGRGYYGAAVPEPMYLYFTDVPRSLGHEVEHFDHVRAARDVGVEAATAKLERIIRERRPSVVLYQHAPVSPEPIDTSMFAGWRDQHCIVSWNSDDDWESDVTLPRAPHFTYMATTYPTVYKAWRARYPNLVLSQWGCYERYARPAANRDILFSFAGRVYRSRYQACRRLRRRAGLKVFGQGARLVRLGIPPFPGMGRVPTVAGRAIDFADINDVWNRTRVSYTPLEGGPSGDVLSLKSRIFDMGLSGTLMLCQHAPSLEDYYEPGTECVTFRDLDECAEHARRLLADEPTRSRIAEAYMRRTASEHLWSHRFVRLFSDCGL